MSENKRTKEEDAIMSRIANLEHELERQRSLLRDERMKHAGIAIGDIVLCQRGRFHGERFRVVEIEVRSYGGKPWVKGNPTKKDGTFGNALRSLFSDWEKEDRAA